MLYNHVGFGVVLHDYHTSGCHLFSFSARTQVTDA